MLQARVFSDEQGEGQSGSVIDSAAEWCADKGARVINMSLGSGENSKASKQIYERIAEEGVLVIGASGNGGTDDLLYPASYEDVISVSAVNVTMQRANFSQYNSEVDITAPGEDIVSTVPGITVTDNSEDSYSASINREFQADHVAAGPNGRGRHTCRPGVIISDIVQRTVNNDP